MDVFETSLSTPLGKVIVISNGTAINGLWFEDQKNVYRGFGRTVFRRELSVFDQLNNWLADYFSGKVPPDPPLVHPTGTIFQLEVWRLLTQIPYGQVVSYGELAQKIAQKRGVARFSAQAVGGAVGRNPLCLLIPCHRVVGARGQLIGYAGGLSRKQSLLEIEGVVFNETKKY